ncbi:NAD(P)-binding domain-containing protein [Streptomyces sp. NPDC050085]|uniref:NAD(P)-binding domain-containing protein n=1 Tax=Streptomyces sp. NPDC050085 TaxID=3365600 RepID=UPI0037BDEFEB
MSEGVEGPPDVFLSPRGARAAAELSRRFANARVCADDQEVADRASVVIIAVRPQDRAEALAGLRVEGGKVVVSAMAGVGIGEVRALLGTGAPVVRAIPLPAVRERRAVTVTCPGHPGVDALFDRLGGALPVPDEATLDAFQTLTSTLASHYRYLATLTQGRRATASSPTTRTGTSAASSAPSAGRWPTTPAPSSSSRAATRRREEPMSASAPPGSPRTTPLP